jgi:hypothetical protein
LAVAVSASALALLPIARWAYADPTTSPSAAGPAPLLDQISQETQNLFQSVRPCLVRVELPLPKWIQPLSSSDNPLQKWGPRLDAGVLRKLQEAQGAGVEAYLATTQPQSTQSETQSETPRPAATEPSANDSRTMILIRPDGEPEFIGKGSQPYDAGIGRPAGPQILGIVLDDRGDVLVPIFIEKEALDGQRLNVLCPQGNPIAAKLIGSDRQTNLTVIQLDRPIGKPARFASSSPPDGALVMLLSPSGESGHLSIWTGGAQDRGLLVSTAGEVGGFVRMGQFLSADGAKPIADELIQDGKVRRATLGVAISQAETPDGHPAMRIEQVIDHSAAAAAGLHEGDFILSLAGEPVGNVPTFAAAIAKRNGQTDLQILRDGQPQAVTVNLKPE